tara:strand:+ start:298 stop:1464 length:1167 start_codon:yes stop_codon:yes gene_type:complete
MFFPTFGETIGETIMKVSFKIRGTANKPVSIYMRSNKKDQKTGLEVFPRDWNSAKQRAFPRTAQLKNLNTKLEKIQYDAATRTETIAYSSTIADQMLEMIEVSYAEAWTEGTKGTYRSFVSLLNRYGKIGYPENLNKQSVDKFIDWMFKDGYSKNYVSRTIRKLRLVAKEIKRLGAEVHPYALEIPPVVIRASERIIQSLTQVEVDLMKSSEMGSKGLENARKLAILQVSTGIRVSDLMKVKKEDIRKVENIYVLDVVAQKTGKFISIPFLNTSTAEFLLKEFPYSIADQKYNKHLKQVLKVSGIDTPTDGYKMIDGRKTLVNLPKYELISSHDMRRTYIQLIYDKNTVPVHQLMLFTQHSNEKTFRLYIGRERNVDEDALKFYKDLQ